MCGIAGLYNLSPDNLPLMLDALSHRGPDDSGAVYDHEHGISLGHKRLSIIDLSAGGRQPITDDSGRLTITYNGELYNYSQLRDELALAGYQFRTQTDTEVVLYAYKHWGFSALNRFRGMFAFAVLDRGPDWGAARLGGDRIPAAPYLFLARDRFGIKPLLYAQTGGGLAFASELKAFLAAGLVEKRITPEAVVEYLGYGAVSQPRTILQDVAHLEPGTALYVSEGGKKLQEHRYWDLAEAVQAYRSDQPAQDYATHVARTRELLEEATRFHLVADVQVGAFLSGGIDSTAVCALMQRIADQPVRTFSIGFQEAFEVTDESSYAKRAADLIGCEHTEVIVGNRDIASLFDAVVQALDQPSVDGTNTYLVSRAASQEVKVALSGLGGDELFAGYPHFQAYQDATFGQATLWDHVAAWVHKVRPNRFTGKRVLKTMPVQDRLALLRNIAGPRQLQKQLHPKLAELCRLYTHPALADGGLPDWEPVSQLSYAECKGYLRSTLLRDNDVMSMAHSLEVRPILLDHKLAEHALSLPAEAKLRDGRMKAALVDAVRDLIPEECWKRPKKGFELPFATWMNGPLLPRVQEAFESPSARQVFSQPFLDEMQKRIKKQTIPRKAWASFILLSWMEQSGCTLG